MDIKPISNLKDITGSISQLSANDNIYFEVSKLESDTTTYNSYKVQSKAMLEPLFKAIASCFNEIKNIKEKYVPRSEFEKLQMKIDSILDGTSDLNNLYVSLTGNDVIIGNKTFMDNTKFYKTTELEDVKCNNITATTNCNVEGTLTAAECNAYELTCTDALVIEQLVAQNNVAQLTAAAAYWS